MGNEQGKPAEFRARDQQWLQEACELVRNKVPETHTFVVFAFPKSSAVTDRCYYASSAVRATAVAALKEWLSHQEEVGNWLKHHGAPHPLTADEALREIVLLCGRDDPADGEGISCEEIVEIVRERLAKGISVPPPTPFAAVQRLLLRPCVIRFALEMEARLRANDHKGGWDVDLWCDLHDRLEEEAEELKQVLRQPMMGGRLATDVTEEAADVANFAMMIADSFGDATSFAMVEKAKRLEVPE